MAGTQIDQKFSGTSRGLLQINPQQSSSASLGYLRRLHASMVNFIAQCSNRHGPVSPGGAAYKLARKTRDLGFPMQQNSRRLTNRKWGQVLSTVVWLLGCVFALHFLTDHPEVRLAPNVLSTIIFVDSLTGSHFGSRTI